MRREAVLVQTSKAAFVLDKDMRPVLKPAGEEVLDIDMNQDKSAVLRYRTAFLISRKGQGHNSSWSHHTGSKAPFSAGLG